MKKEESKGYEERQCSPETKKILEEMEKKFISIYKQQIKDKKHA